MQKTPRILMTVNSDSTCSTKGIFVDHRGNTCSHSSTHISEEHAREYLQDMRSRELEFSIQINRKA